MSLNQSYTTKLQRRTYAPPPQIRTRRTRWQRIANTLTPFGWCCVGLLAFWSAVAVLVLR